MVVQSLERLAEMADPGTVAHPGGERTVERQAQREVSGKAVDQKIGPRVETVGIFVSHTNIYCGVFMRLLTGCGFTSTGAATGSTPFALSCLNLAARATISSTPSLTFVRLFGGAVPFE